MVLSVMRRRNVISVDATNMLTNELELMKLMRKAYAAKSHKKAQKILKKYKKLTEA